MNPLASILDLIYPRVCEVCGRTLVAGERVMCLYCNHRLPRTMSHLDNFNEVHHRIASTTEVDRAASMFYYYKESPYVEIFHRAKYKNRPKLLYDLSKAYAMEIAGSGFFDSMDLVLPVPLHRLKLIRRGYNQSYHIAKGLAEATGMRVGDNLIALRGHATQTSRGSFTRWLNTKDVYGVKNSSELAGKHVLVVDDVITTGSTILSCVKAIKQASPTTTVSVLSLGLSHLS